MKLQELFNIVENHKISFSDEYYTYTENDYGIICICNAANKQIMYLSKQDWLDVCNWKK